MSITGKNSPDRIYVRPSTARRLLAFVVDALIGGLVFFSCISFFLFVMFSYLTYREVEFLHGMSASGFYLFILFVFVSFAWFIAYTLLRDSFEQGQSWGKKMFGLLVINVETGLPCKARESATRNFPALTFLLLNFFIPVLLLPLLFAEPVAVLTTRDGARIGDGWARTRVVPAGNLPAVGSEES